MEYDQKSKVKTEVGFFEAAAGTTSTSAVIDVQGYEAMTWLFQSGDITTGDFTFTYEQSDTGAFAGEEEVVDDTLVIGSASFAANDDNATQRVGIIGKSRYQRVTMTGANTPVAEMSCSALMGEARVNPTED